jgi:hypothetical protein
VQAGEVVVHEVDRDGSGVVLDLLGESISEPVNQRIPIGVVRFPTGQFRNTEPVLLSPPQTTRRSLNMSETYRPYRERHPPPATDILGDAEGTSSGALISLGYLTALFIPIVGFVLGVVIATRPSRRTSKHGVPVIMLSSVAFVIAFAMFVSWIVTRT